MLSMTTGGHGDVLGRLRNQAEKDLLRITLHGHQAMVEESVSYADMRHVLMAGEIIENYPDHQRGACCLVNGMDAGRKRFLHVCCTTEREIVIIITIYEPKSPKWVTPTMRRKKQ